VGLFSNGDSGLAQREKVAERDHERERHSVMQSDMRGTQTVDVPDHFEDLVESGVPEESVYLLSQLMSKDWVLSNLKDAEVHEQRWLTENVYLGWLALHPRRESQLASEYRRWLFDDPGQAVEPLSDAARLEGKNFIRNHIARLSRGREGWQQEEMSKQYRVSETRKANDDGGRGWFR
jgi:hypothetical protein